MQTFVTVNSGSKPTFSLPTRGHPPDPPGHAPSFGFAGGAAPVVLLAVGVITWAIFRTIDQT
jgi:hypothetical protein